jgi:predicted GIY-YIG superfamily endonuclease
MSLIVGKNDIATTHPNLAKEAEGWDPTTVSAGSDKKREWKCQKNHIWKAVIKSRTRGSNCPYCSNTKILIGFNDLATTNPDIANEAHGWDPTSVSAGSDKKREWKCKQGHIWLAPPYVRKVGNNCPFCSGRFPIVGETDLVTTHPEIAEEAHRWDPTTVSAGSDKQRDWKCVEGHLWKATVGSRARLKSGCPFCAGQKVIKGINDLATTHPDIAKEAFGWDPTDYIAGTHIKLDWKCAKGHIWKTSGDVRIRPQGCPFCSNQKLLSGFNDLATTHPSLASEASGWDPVKVITGTNKKLEWKCKEGHIWKATGNDRKQGYGCPTCSKTGFDPNKDAYFYFLIHSNWELYQIGITNQPKDRLKKHNKNGFDLLELRGPMDGHTAQELETALLRYLKSQKADLSPEQIAGKFDGYSESWTIDSYKVNNLKELIDKANEAGF